MIVKLMGGLGNQMFQYAFGRSIQIDRNWDVFFDYSFIQNRRLQGDAGATVRNSELNIFDVSPQKKELFYLNFNNNLCNKIYYKVYCSLFFSVKKEKVLFKIDAKLLNNLSSKSYVLGYFQTEDYFVKHRNILLSEFTFKNPFTDNSNKYLELILSKNSVAVHVRRGDYILANNINIYGVCAAEYYINSIKYIKQRVVEPYFFIFSDDLDWVKEQSWVQGLNVIFVTGNTHEFSYEDMRLMSLCQHNIIANSSFSWWGAWLNVNKEKIVIAPSLWFAEEKLNKSIDRLIPDNWIKI